MFSNLLFTTSIDLDFFFLFIPFVLSEIESKMGVWSAAENPVRLIIGSEQAIIPLKISKRNGTQNLIESELDSYGTFVVVSWGSGILDPSGPATRVWPIFGRLIFKTPIYKRLATSKEDLSLYLFLISLYELLPVDTFLEGKKEKKPNNNVPLDMPGTPSGLFYCRSTLFLPSRRI